MISSETPPAAWVFALELGVCETLPTNEARIRPKLRVVLKATIPLHTVVRLLPPAFLQKLLDIAVDAGRLRLLSKGRPRPPDAILAVEDSRHNRNTRAHLQGLGARWCSTIMGCPNCISCRGGLIQRTQRRGRSGRRSSCRPRRAGRTGPGGSTLVPRDGCSSCCCPPRACSHHRPGCSGRCGRAAARRRACCAHAR